MNSREGANWPFHPKINLANHALDNLRKAIAQNQLIELAKYYKEHKINLV